MRIVFYTDEEADDRLRDLNVNGIVYLASAEDGEVSYHLIDCYDHLGEKVILVRHREDFWERELIDILSDSPDLDTALERIEGEGNFVCFYAEPAGSYVRITFSEPPSWEELRDVLLAQDLDALGELFARWSGNLSLDTVKRVLAFEDYTPYMLGNFLGHILFRIDEEELEELYRFLKEKENRSGDGQRRVFAERSLYVKARIAGSSEGEGELEELIQMLESYLLTISSPAERALTIYEVVASLGTENTRALKRILYGFDRYLTYTDEFSPLIFGDMGMGFHSEWESTENTEYRELALVMLQKAVFSVRELLRLGKASDMSINLNNIFAYISVLIPLLYDESEELLSEDVINSRLSEVRETFLLGIDLFLNFFDHLTLENFRSYFTSDEDADSMVESTFANFLAMVESYLGLGIDEECEEAWKRAVPEEPTPEEMREGALTLRRLVKT